MHAILTVVALAALPSVAFAQQQTDQEYQDTQVEPKAGKTTTRVGFETEVHSYNNLDFRPLDESSDQVILDSDDRGQFAFSGINLALAYRAAPDMTLNFAASHRGLWGNDQTGSVNRFGGFMYVTGMSLDWKPGAKDRADEGVTVRIGRQYYELGGIGGSPDFILSDVLDGIRVDFPLGEIGRVEALPYMLLSSTGDNINANFSSYIGQSAIQTYSFRGDTITQRSGGQVVLDGLVDNVDLRAHAFYTDIGAMGTGADISYNGDLGNFADNDWVANLGARGQYSAGSLVAWGEFDASMGVDRKELVAQDVDTFGMAYGAGARLDTGKLSATASYFDAWGPGYTADGMQYSHGYVSMKGRQAGGLLANRYLGWHPTAYVGTFGVDTSSHDRDRKSGTRTIHAGVSYSAKAVRVAAAAWMFQDTGVTLLKISELDTLNPPYGYSRAEFAAEQRLGRTLGQEVDLTVTYNANDVLSFFGEAGAFLPGAFYSINVDRSAGNQLGGQSMAWAADIGTRVQF